MILNQKQHFNQIKTKQTTHSIVKKIRICSLGMGCWYLKSKNQSISNIIRWNAGLLGRSSRRLMVQSLFDRLGIKQWVNNLA